MSDTITTTRAGTTGIERNKDVRYVAVTGRSELKCYTENKLLQKVMSSKSDIYVIIVQILVLSSLKAVRT